MSMTKEDKEGNHYCPNCGANANGSIKVVTIDKLKQRIGKKHGYPYYGSTIRCKCGWSGGWYIPKKVLIKIKREYIFYVNNKNKMTHFRRNKY